MRAALCLVLVAGALMASVVAAGPAWPVCVMGCAPLTWNPPAYAVCMLGCSALACVDPTTSVMLTNGTRVAVPNLQPGMLVHGAHGPVRVVAAVASVAVSGFYEITTHSHAVNVTGEHLAVIDVNGTMLATRVANLAVGDMLKTRARTREAILAIRRVPGREKWDIVTADGTILYNDLIFTTVCGDLDVDAADTPRNLDRVLDAWRTAHTSMLHRE